jgi:hypothetical protein
MMRAPYRKENSNNNNVKIIKIIMIVIIKGKSHIIIIKGENRQ